MRSRALFLFLLYKFMATITSPLVVKQACVGDLFCLMLGSAQICAALYGPVQRICAVSCGRSQWTHMVDLQWIHEWHAHVGSSGGFKRV